MSTDSTRDLSLFQLEVLLKSTAKDEIKSKSHKSWLSISDTKLLLTALVYDGEKVYLVGMGRYFNIKYKDDKVWLSPSDGHSFTPCGWFTPSALKKEVRELNAIKAA